MNETRFRVTPGVIYDQFDDEVVAINMDTGVYHHLVGSAADAFLLLSQQATVGEVAEALAGKYAAGREQIRGTLDGFLEQLREENLISSDEVPLRQGPLQFKTDQTSVPFMPPQVDSHHDLDSLMLLDPIHEVDEQGWPYRKVADNSPE